MPIDLRAEKLIALHEVPDLLPAASSGKRTHKETVVRWAKAGLKGHVLETVMAGGRRATTVEAVGRFLNALNGGPAVVVPSADRDREARHRAAMRQLNGAGN